MDQYSLVHRLEIQQNIREMVRWHRNHPSVILWEPILNESHIPAQFQQRVHDIVHEEYPVDPCYTGSDYGPMVFIASYWGRIKCKVRLYHNDVLVEARKPEPIAIPHPPFIFKDMKKYLTRERTQIRVEGLIDGKEVATDTRDSPGVPKKLILEADFIGYPLKADGSDLVMIYCKVIDEDGNVTPMTADHQLIRFEVGGEGKIIGDQTIGANPIKPVLGQTGILVQATRKAGKIFIKATLEHPGRYSAVAIEEAYLEITSTY